jgi:hypothetical protein
MSEKKIVVDTDRRTGQVFKVKESGGRFYAYKDGRELGEARSLDDAIQIIKVSVDGSVRKIKIE